MIMCGTEFCGPCVDERVTAWATGLAHDVPTFGDKAQRATAIMKRVSVLFRVIRTSPVGAVEWPEMRLLDQSLVLNSGMSFKEVLLQIPHGIPAPPRGANKRKRCKYRRRVERFYTPTPYASAYNRLWSSLANAVRCSVVQQEAVIEVQPLAA